MTNPPVDPRDLEAWVARADEDFLVANVMAAGHIAQAPQVICFHAQQCCEKYLKAILLLHGVDFPKVHELDALLELAKPADPSLEALREQLLILNPYAVELRYPGASVTEDQAREALEIAGQVRAAIRERLGLPAD